MEVLLTSRQVAAILQVSASTLSRWRDRDEGPAWLDLGGMPRYAIEDVTSFIQAVRHEH